MINALKHFGGCLAAFMVLDFVWLGLVMNKFNAEQLSAIGRINNGKFEILYGPAIAAYLLMAASVVFFAGPRVAGESSLLQVWLWGAFLGLIVFGIFDFTNLAILKNYPWAFALADMSWGVFVYGLVTSGFWWLAQRQ